MNFRIKNIGVPPLLLAGGLLFTAPALPLHMPLAHAQEIETTDESMLASISLPGDTLKVGPKDTPKEVSDALKTIIQAGGSKVKRGKTEVFAWAGNGYTKSRATGIKTKIGAALKRAGWEYEEGEQLAEAPGFTLVTAMRTTPSRQALIGFWASTDEALMLAWTQMLPANPDAAPATEDDSPAPAIPSAAQNPNQTRTLSPTAASPTAGGAITVDVGEKISVNVMKTAMPKLPTFAAVAAKPGYVRGYVKDFQGKPLKGAVIGVASTAVGGAETSAAAKTDAKGYYELMVPFGVARFYNAGYAVDYGEGLAALGLHPADGEADEFASAQGAVENWVLLPYGVADRAEAQQQPQYLNNYYGGSVTVNYQQEAIYGKTGIPSGSTLEVVLTPEGTLFDGSAGKPIVVRKTVSDSSSSWFIINNIPIGTYKLSARLAGNGRALKIKESGPNQSKPFGLDPKETSSTSTLTFRPYSASADRVRFQRGNWAEVAVELSIGN